MPTGLLASQIFTESSGASHELRQCNILFESFQLVISGALAGSVGDRIHGQLPGENEHGIPRP